MAAQEPRTARPDLLRQFFPTLERTPPPATAMPHVTVRQFDGGFGKRRWRAAGQR
jgi:hypothetical protein